jgi:Bacterial membrane protein YfhO
LLPIGAVVVMKMLRKVSRWIDGYSLIHAMGVFFGFLCFYLIFFSPFIFHHQLLAFGDGISYFLPAYYSPRSLWTDLVFGGYPLAADPQNMTWYPPSLLLSLIPHSWNAFVILAYVLAGSFSYCYAYTLTSSRLAGIVAGLTYSMSGFMISHLSVAGMTHAAAWIPLLICALERIRHRVTRRWLVIGVIALICCLLGGHPQVSIYGAGLGVIYALFLGWSAPIGRWNYYRYVLGIITVAIGIYSIQLIPAIELSRLSLRSAMTEEAFFAGSLPLWQSIQYLFPFIFGSGIALSPYNIPYWSNEANAVDIATYVGILPLMLAAIGLSINYRRRVDRFWLVIATITFFIIFGKYFLPAKLMYFIPVYNVFRIPARHSIELALAVSVLAALGIETIQRKLVEKQLLQKTIFASLLVMTSAVLVIVFCNQSFQMRVRQIGIDSLSFWPLDNPAVGIPIVIFGCSCLSIIFLKYRPQSRYAILFLLASLILDTGSYGFWFHDWTVSIMPEASKIELSSPYLRYREILQRQYQRLLVQGGIYASPNYGAYSNLLYALGDVNPIFPNLNRLWDIPLSNGYSPLVLTRVSQLMKLDFTGLSPYEALSNQNRSLDLMSTKYVLSQQLLPIRQAKNHLGATVPNGREKRTFWPENSFLLWLGGKDSGLPVHPSSATIDLPKITVQTTEIALNTSLSNSVIIPNNQEVMNIKFTDIQGNIENHPFLAGRDTSEQAFDCPDVKPAMRHQRAKLYDSVTIDRPGIAACESHSYQSIIKLDQPRILKKIELQFNNASAKIAIRRISLIDSQSGLSLPILSLPPSVDMTKWREVEKLGDGAIYENQQVLPRAWVVSEVVSLKPEEVIQTIHTSRFPNGRIYQPEKTALVEIDDNSLSGMKKEFTGSDTIGKATIIQKSDTNLKIETDAISPAFLVLSDVNYPGWQAWVDGQPAKILQTNYIQRGVTIPAGQHVVRFEFHPLSFKIGAGIAVASILGGLYGLTRMKPVDESREWIRSEN